MRVLWWMAASTLFTVACTAEAEPSTGNPGDDERESDEADVTTTEPAAPDPPGSDVLAVQEIVEGLLGRYDDAVNEFVADPSIAEDPTHPVVEDFLALFEPGNEFAQASVEGWVAQAQRGETLAPASPDHPVSLTNIEGTLTTLGDDEVRFAQCAVLRYARLVEGEERERVEELLLPGEGTAVRVEGRWLLDELSTPPGMQGCDMGTGPEGQG